MADLDLRELAFAQQDYVVNIRRHLHQIPELRWEEEQTLNAIRAEIFDIKNRAVAGTIEITEKKGGLVVDLTFGPDNLTRERVLFRADVDALPITEQTGLPFASQNGCSHACGHDCHSAILLGALRAIVLEENTRMWRKHIRFVWQRAEENPITPSGGDVLVNEENVCDGVAQVYGLHVLPTGDKGVIYSRPGAILGNSGRMKIEITTSGGHVARPHQGVNAIDIAADIVIAMRNFALTTLGPVEPCSLVPTIVNAGTASNVLPSEAVLWLGVRTMLPREEHLKFMRQVHLRVAYIAAWYRGAEVKIEAFPGHPATINDRDALIGAVAHLESSDCELEYREIEPILGGEDFAHYLLEKPGTFFMLGTGGPDAADYHTPRFNPDEETLSNGVRLWLQLAAM